MAKSQSTPEKIRATKNNINAKLKPLCEKRSAVYEKSEAERRAKIARCETEIREKYAQQFAYFEKKIGRLLARIDDLQAACPHKNVKTTDRGLYWHCKDCGKVKDDTLPAHF